MAKLECYTSENHGVYQEHKHNHAHIIMPLKSPIDVMINNKLYHFTLNQLGYVPPNKLHQCIFSKETIIINIPRSMISDSDLDILCRCDYLPLTGDLIPLRELIQSEVQKKPQSDSIRYLYYYLYSKLITYTSIKSIRYIHEHFSESVSIADLAKIENYNENYYISWFKKYTGTSPSKYISQVRIEKAKELLAISNYRLIDIAMQVGYNSNVAFTRAFKNLTGISPTEYRQSCAIRTPSEIPQIQLWNK